MPEPEHMASRAASTLEGDPPGPPLPVDRHPPPDLGDSTARRPLTSRKATRVAAAFLSLALLAGVGLVLHSQQSKSRADIVDRFNLRAEIGARFLGSYIADLTSHQADVAAAKLGGPTVSQAALVDVTTTLGFQASVLLDEDGHLLRAHPNNPDLLGTDLGAKYEHLGEAVAGRVAVSGVVPSAVRSVPVVGLAVPFESVAGPRVFSAALSISDTSLGSSYLRNLSPFSDQSVWLVDGAGQTVASSSTATQSPDRLQVEDPDLFAALQEGPAGAYDSQKGVSRFARVSVEGTPWQMIITVPESQLFQPVSGFIAVVPWLVFAGLALAVVTAMLLQIRLARARAEQLDRIGLLSLTDPMTGLYNRRGFKLLGEHLLKDAARQKHPAALMYFDMDGLKTINDTLGHGVGDEAIGAVAGVLRSTFRDSDVIARLGGDEFCVVGVLPGSPMDGSAQLARLHDALAIYNSRTGASFTLGLSGGLAMWDPLQPSSLAELEAEADRLMYADKHATEPQIAVAGERSVRPT